MLPFEVARSQTATLESNDGVQGFAQAEVTSACAGVGSAGRLSAGVSDELHEGAGLVDYLNEVCVAALVRVNA